MNRSKLDAALAAVVERGSGSDDRRLPVFIELEGEPAEEQSRLLGRLGAGDAMETGGIQTAVLSAREVAELSEQPWVRRLRLSRQLRFLDERAPTSPAGAPLTGKPERRGSRDDAH